MISRIRINQKTTQKADFLDLCLELKNPNTNTIEVMRKVNGSISKGRNKRDRYIRNNQDIWYLTLSRGIKLNQKITVIKENRQFQIQYI